MENPTLGKKFQAGTKIAIVEDDKFLGGLVTKKLTEEGCEVKHIDNGEVAVATIESELPDLIFLDILLPTVGGFEILQALKQSPKTKDIPVIMLSNLGERGDIQKGIDLGAASFLIKASMTIDSIVSEASRILRARRK